MKDNKKGNISLACEIYQFFCNQKLLKRLFHETFIENTKYKKIK